MFRKLLVTVFASLALAGSGAAAPLLAEPQPFLAQYGLDAPAAPVVMVPPASLFDILPGSGQTNGYVGPEGVIFIAEGMEPVEHVRVVLHEFLHMASGRTFVNDCAPGDPLTLCDRDWAVVFEEGPVEAVTADLLPRFWKWHTGKRLRGQGLWWINLAYEEATIWRAASARATGKPVWSRAAREWRAAVLTVPLRDRPALLQALPEKNARTKVG